MKKTALLFVLVWAITATLCAPASAQNKKQSIFNTQKECETALSSGDFAYYIPVDIRDKEKNPIDNTTVFPVKLEGDQCRLQKTMKGEKWVIQMGDTLLRARKNESGELKIFARDDCGNADLTPTPPLQTEPSTKTPPTSTNEPSKKPVELVIPIEAGPRIEIRDSFNTYQTSQQNISLPQLPTTGFRTERHCGGWCIAGWVAGGVAVVVGGYQLLHRDHDNRGKPPGGTTGGVKVAGTYSPRVAVMIGPRRTVAVGVGFRF